jgi:MSHA pilin protein MshD
MFTRHHRSIRMPRYGFTLVEAVLSCVIMAVLLLPALSLIGAAARTRKTQPEQTQALTLAKHLLTEIMQSRYADPDGTEAGETRASWDDVSDYDKFQEKPPTHRDGTAIAGLTGWKRQVKIKLADPANPANNPGSDLGLKQISVTVTSASGTAYTLTGLRSSASGYERRPTSSTTYASWVEVTIDVGGPMEVSGTNLVNQVP